MALSLHILGGTLGLLAGAFALYAGKGGRLHRRSGTLFVVAMLVMSATGAAIALSESSRVSVLAGSLTFYLVATAWLTVRRSPRPYDPVIVAGLLTAVAIGSAGIALGMAGVASDDGRIDGLPPAPAFAFGIVAMLAATGDSRVAFGPARSRRYLLMRHLWRMCAALLLAAAAFFLGQAPLFPEPLRHPLLLALPVLLVAGLMLYWMLRMRLARSVPGN